MRLTQIVNGNSRHSRQKERTDVSETIEDNDNYFTYSDFEQLRIETSLNTTQPKAFNFIRHSFKYFLVGKVVKSASEKHSANKLGESAASQLLHHLC